MTHLASPRCERLSWSSPFFRVLYAPAYRIDWVPSNPRDLGISAGPRGLSAVTVPRSAFRKAGSSSRELASPSETIRLSPARRVATSSAYLGVSSLFAMPAPGVHVRQESHLLTSLRPRRFARPRRFSPPSALRACFIPLPRPGFRFRGFLPPARSADSSPSRPSSPLAPGSCHLAMAPAPATSTSRVCSD
jgi:hypothetical protein